MDLLLDTFKNFFGMVEGRFIIATIIMIIIVLGAIYLIYLITASFRSRREAVEVQLPDINHHGQVVTDNIAKFTEVEKITVELIDTDEDEVVESNVEPNDEVFLAALSMETGQLITTDNIKLDMPEVGEINYEQIKEEMRREKDEEVLERIRKVAEADSEDELDNLSLTGAESK